MLKMNCLGEFVDDFDPYNDDERRASVYANCRVDLGKGDMEMHECDECGRLFQPRSHSHKYCSDGCKKAAYKRIRALGE